MKEVLEQLQKEWKELQEKLAQSQTGIKKEEVEALVSGILAKMHPPEKKIVFAKIDSEDGEKISISLPKFLKMVRYGDQRLKTVMSEGTPAQGGYIVPPEYLNDIVYNVPSSAVAYPDCDDIPMGSNVLNIPRRLTDVTIYWVEEDASKTLTKPTLERPTLTLKKMAAIVPFTDELLDDENVGLVSKVSQWINDAIAAEKDRLVLVGNTGAGDVAMGVGYAVGVNAVPQAGASLAYDDLVDLMVSVPEAYQADAKFYLNLATLGIIMKLKDLQGRPIISLPAAGMPGTILGKPFKLSGQIPSNLGVGLNESMIFYGDFKKGIWLGNKRGGGLTVTVTNSAVSGVGAVNVGQNAFMQDETWYRFVLRHGQTVIRPAILGRLTGVK